MGIRSKDKRDIYYKMSKENGYRARSIYKLAHIDDEFDIFKNVSKVVDLCGAPGSWSQYAAERASQVVTVDLQDIRPIKGVYIIKEDITSQSCVDKIQAHFGKADLILCDGAPDITGIHDVDEYFQSKLVCSALEISLKIGILGSSFIGKIFRGKYCRFVVALFQEFYKKVIVVKPKASRSASIECFIYAKDLFTTEGECTLNCMNEDVPDFEVIGCGKGPDSDLTMEYLEGMSISPISAPINPPYEESIKERKK